MSYSIGAGQAPIACNRVPYYTQWAALLAPIGQPIGASEDLIGRNRLPYWTQLDTLLVRVMTLLAPIGDPIGTGPPVVAPYISPQLGSTNSADSR